MFLYLNEVGWTGAWVDGGPVPLSLASRYRDVERMGTRTPDENLVMSIRKDGDPAAFRVQAAEHEARDISWLTRLDDGTIERRFMDVGAVDGLILSFANHRNDEVWLAVGKKACVEIVDIAALINTISSQLIEQKLLPSPGMRGKEIGEAKPCAYTDTAQRDTFLKSTEDAWQDEFRAFWLAQQPATVIIPAGTGRVVWTAPPV